jgi:hypothetical protein
MVEQRPRRLWQIHLSTAIVMMFVSGAFIWANVRHSSTTGVDGMFIPLHGWPLVVHYDLLVLDSEEAALQPEDWDGYWNRRNMILNSAIGVLLLTTVAVGCEWSIRRRRAVR